MTNEQAVASHYSNYDVLARIREGLAAMGHGPDHIALDVLKPVDEFHIGGAEATENLLGKLDIPPDAEILDIGSGIGGPARTMATRFGAKVTGVDLTPAFVEAAQSLSRMTDLDGRVGFRVASATALPFDDRSFDLATMLHVGMNISDKMGLFREAWRVLRDGGTFAVYDVMRVGDGELNYPVPWAETADVSALAAPEEYRSSADAAGFTLTHEENRQAIALAFFERMQAAAAGSAPPPLGLHLLLGATAREKTANMIDAIRAGTIAPVQMIFVKRTS